MNRKFRWPGLFLLIALAGCSQSGILDKIAPDAVASAKSYFEMLRNHQYQPIQNLLNKSIKDPDLQKTLAGVAAHIPDEKPISVKTVGLHVFRNSHTCNTDVTLEYEFPSQWLLFRVISRNEDGEYSITGMYVKPIPDSLEDTNRFSLYGKPYSAYFFLLFAILIPAFTIYVLVLCIRTKGLGKKWLWIIFILVGFGRLGVNWTTGQWGFHYLFIQLFSVSAAAQLYGPWIISLSIPLGAILFLVYRPDPNPSDGQFAFAPDSPPNNDTNLGQNPN
jgi:hypothetical protein